LPDDTWLLENCGNW